MSSRRGVMVTVPELAAALAGSAPPALLDVRWTLGEVPGSGRQRYAAGHLPGAAFLDLESALTRHTGDRRDGRHPLPVPAVLRDALAEAGVRAGQQIVVYDEPGSFAAGRAWWVLRWVGLPVRVLDGGLTAWTAAGHPLESGDAEIPAVPASDSLPLSPPLTGGHLPTLSADDAATAPDRGVLVDVRAPERFRGEVEPIDPIAGHVPGAKNRPYASNLGEGRFKPAAQLAREFAALLDGREPQRVIAMCGSGVTACHHLLAMTHAGLHGARLFTGSWSGWVEDPARPVATGD